MSRIFSFKTPFFILFLVVFLAGLLVYREYPFPQERHYRQLVHEWETHTCRRSLLRRFQKYYVSRLNTSDKASAATLLGFVLYHLGRPVEALDMLRQSVVADPHFFWSRYNEGIILYRRGQYPEAKKIFEGAVRIKAEETMHTLERSDTLYAPITRQVAPTIRAKIDRLGAGHVAAYEFIALCQFHIRHEHISWDKAKIKLQQQVQAKDVTLF